MNMNGRIARGNERPDVRRMFEDVIGCKWSLTVLDLVRHGTCRPGAMEHAVEGLTAKVLGERLRKFVRYGVLEKQSFAEVPPRVEYRFTEFGESFLEVLDAIEALAARGSAPSR